VRLSQSYKVCPICGTPAHHNASICTTCGATLSDVASVGERNGRQNTRTNAKTPYEERFGETDLLEGTLPRRGEAALFGVATLLVLLLCGGIVWLFGSQFLMARILPPSATPSRTPLPTLALAVTPTIRQIILVTNTPRPMPPNLVTVTAAPPTETPVPPPTPCTRIVQPGDTLLSIAFFCGHNDLAVINLIVAENELDSPESLQLGQEIIVPPPTPIGNSDTPNGDVTPAAQDDTGVSVAAASTATPDPNIIPTETLQPGVAWHVVRRDENMLTIAFLYGANAEILSQLNPEVPFLQCDFEFDSGGPRCTVLLIEGQPIRVPVPSATPTLSPTPSGSETPTPTATATFNAPNALSPGDRAFFRYDELVTLRWVTTGTLGSNQVYRLLVRDLSNGSIYSADTRDLFFIIPAEWQGKDQRRHEYEWTVSVVDTARVDSPTFVTTPRVFIWESLPATPAR
jgi:murein DD-endopeptidase MepM/ murein hydrolase activator NlpD